MSVGHGGGYAGAGASGGTLSPGARRKPPLVARWSIDAFARFAKVAILIWQARRCW
jgi:hypothetical protein